MGKLSNNYDFILDTLKYSYSSVSTYANCPFSFKLSYIEMVDREQNFFSDYGSLIHACIEQYFRNNLDSFELIEYYDEMYDKYIKNPPPPYPPGMEERYRESGREFFSGFSFEREKYNVLDVEDTVEFSLPSGVSFTARPDLVLQDKKTNKIYLFDYKSSVVFKTDKFGNEKVDIKKLEGYTTQAYIYAYALRKKKNYKISNIIIWFTRHEKKHVIKWNKKDEDKAITWIETQIEKIKADEEFLYNNSNQFFCQNLCNVRNSCPFWSRV